MPDSLTSIGYNAFEDCESLESITLSDSLTSIGDYAFEDCIGVGGVAFGRCESLKSIYVSKEKVEEYKKMLGEEYAKYVKVKE